MKQLLVLLLFFFSSLSYLSAQTESAYFDAGHYDGTIPELMSKTSQLLSDNGFRIIGEYQAGNSDDLAVLCYTNPELEKLALSFEDRGALAAALKIGFRKDGDKIAISMLNPMYLFYAYFVDGIDGKEKELRNISEQAKSTVSKLGIPLKPFGGALDKGKLQKYHYKVMMPYFKDAEVLNSFDSFDQGVAVIRKNLNAGKGSTQKVYELVYPDKDVAVFGVGLFDPAKGESAFLPVIGDDHVAAMPYEIILQGKEATILPGRYRIALHWPELTMGTFMKIMSTPGDIKDMLEALTTK